MEVSDPNGAFVVVVVVVVSGKKGSANSSNTRRGDVVDDFAKGSVLQNAVTSNGSTNEAPEVATARLWSGPLFFNREGGEA